MVAFQPRIPVRFESSDGNIVVTFPRAQYSLEQEQGLRVPAQAAIGANGVYDHLGIQSGAREPMIVRLAFAVWESDPWAVDVAADALMADIHRIGKGKLYAEGQDGVGGTLTRWTNARALQVPTLNWEAGAILWTEHVASWRCDPWWYASGQTIVTETVTAQGQQWTVTNPGDLDVMAVVIRIMANAAGGFTNPTLLNLTNGHQVRHIRTAADADSEVRIDSERHTAEWSVNAGGSYADDIANFELGAVQVAWMRLQPGSNTFTYSDEGTPNADVEISFYAAFAR